MHSLQYSTLGLWHIVLSIGHLFALRIHCGIFNKVHVSLGPRLEQFQKRRHPRLYRSVHRSFPNEGTAIHLPICFRLLSYSDSGILCCLLDQKWSLKTVITIWTDFLSRRGLHITTGITVRYGGCFLRCCWLTIQPGTPRSSWSFCTFEG